MQADSALLVATFRSLPLAYWAWSPAPEDQLNMVWPAIIKRLNHHSAVAPRNSPEARQNVDGHLAE
jgi:hypothetical protein